MTELFAHAWEGDDEHFLAMGFAPFSSDAVKAVDVLVQRGTWRGVRTARKHDEPALLAFGLLAPAPSVAALRPAFSISPYETFIADQFRARAELNTPPRFEMDAAQCLAVRAVAWLADRLGAPTAYWYHHGHDGLVHEYAFGFTPGNPTAMMFYNEDEFKPDDHPPAVPRSAVTACLWHVGAKSAQNLVETSFPDEVRSFGDLKT